MATTINIIAAPPGSATMIVAPRQCNALRAAVFAEPRVIQPAQPVSPRWLNDKSKHVASVRKPPFLIKHGHSYSTTIDSTYGKGVPKKVATELDLNDDAGCGTITTRFFLYTHFIQDKLD